MRRQAWWLGISFVGLLVPVGCGKFKKPSTVVHSVYIDCMDGEYPKARVLFAKPTRQASDGFLEAPGLGVKELCDRMTNSGTLDAVEVRNESVDGDRATVWTDLYFHDGRVKQAEATDLIRENGAWKVRR